MKKNNNIKILLYEVILIMFLFEPNIFVKYRLVNNIFIVGAIFSFIIAVCLIIKKDVKIKIFTLIGILYQILNIVVTIINSQDIYKVGHNAMIIIALLLYAEYYFRTNKFNKFLKILNNIFSAYLLINIILFIVKPEGLYNGQTIHFLGIRTRFTEYVFALFATSYICLKNKLISKKKFFADIVIGILNIILPSISTAIIGVIVLILMNFYFKVIHNKNYINENKVIFYGILTNALVVFFRIHNIFSVFIEKVLGKNVTLSERTKIWDLSYKYIFDKWILIGHGYPDNGNFVYLRGYNTNWQSHNQILQLLFETGIIGCFVFFYLIFLALKGSKKCDNRDCRIWIISIIFSFLVMMIVEIYGYYIPFYAVLVIAYYLECFNGRN